MPIWKILKSRRARAYWPLVCAGGQALWVVGSRIAHPFRITDKSKIIFHFEIKEEVS
jgi:hypothetical protein